MTNLIINRVNFILSEEQPNLYLSKTDNLIFRMQVKYFKQHITHQIKEELLNEWLKGCNDEDNIFFSFIKPEFNDYKSIKLDNFSFI